MGAADAPVQLVELSDFECPACKNFHTVLKSLRERFPAQVALTYVHFPLDYHRFAEPAARAAECAGVQGRFETMHDQLFEQQESFGLRPWSELAREAGVADLPAFEACIKSTTAMPRLVEGKTLGNMLEVRGIPTILVNGWKFSPAPSAKELDRMVKAILAGKSPV